MGFRRGLIALLTALVMAATARPQANSASDVLRARAADELYNLDAERALASWREATAVDPNDAGAWRGLGGAVLARIAMLRGTMTVDSYLGRVTTTEVAASPAPPELVKEFDTAITRAVTLGRERVATNPNDVQARYELGAALGLRASYYATVDGSTLSAFRAAREAFDATERVLALDPSRADAGLIVGTYRYLVSTLSMPMRVVAYAAGFGGGRERGLGLIEKASGYRGDNQADARLVLVLLYNREARYGEALTQLDRLRASYPRNRLFWLETGSTLIRANRPADAERELNEGMAMLARDSRLRMLGEEALWLYRRGAARVALGHLAEAKDDLERSIAANGRRWVQGRAHLELGQIAIQQSQPQQARVHFLAASRLGDSDRDGATAARARDLLKRVPGR